MNPDYQNIVVKTREAAQVASVTPLHPEAKLRELVQLLWDEYIRLSKGELLIQHAVFRQPVKIIFPMPAYKQD